MKKFTGISIILLALLLLLPGHALARDAVPMTADCLHEARHAQMETHAYNVRTAGAGGRVRHDQIIASDSLQYGHIVSYNARGRQSAHYLSFRPGGSVRPIVSAGGSVFGANNINTVISREQNRGRNVLGGINADFFSFQTGAPMGIYISDGQLRSSHQGRGAVFFREDGSAFLSDNPYITFALTNQNGQTVTTSLLNKYRQPGWLFLYDEHFAATTRTSTPGREVLFRITSGSMTVGGELSLEVTQMISSTGAINIPAGHIILSADQNSPYVGQLDRFSVGDRVTLHVSSRDPRAEAAVWGVGGGDILVSGGNRTSGWDAGVAGAHPRTALGIRPDGSVILYTVDGRIEGHSAGLTLAELADELVALGARYVLNLDGGGSTTFSYRIPGQTNTAVQNRPSAGSLRACSTFILLTGVYQSGGSAANIQFHPGHAAVLGGSFITPAALSNHITMTDRGYFPLSTTGLDFSSYAGNPALGEQEGTGFRTTPANISSLLRAYATNGAVGRVRLNLVARPDRVDVRLGGQNIHALTLAQGDQVSLHFHAIADSRELISSRDAYTTEIAGGVATIDGSGRLTATGAPGSRGHLAVRAGGVTRHVEIIVAEAFPDTVGHWAERDIARMRGIGVVTGVRTDQGTLFFPEQRVTRAEFSAMFTRLLGLDVGSYHLTGQEFVDDAQIPAWAKSYVAAMFRYGYITGRPDAGGMRFDPASPTVRAEAFTMLGRRMDGHAPHHVLYRFADHAEIPAWARTEIARLVYAGLLTGSDGRLHPLGNLSRAEAATILARLELSLAQ